jgi:FecR protein
MLATTLRTALVVLAAALAGSASADADNTRPAGVITALQGTATVSRASLGAPRALKFRDDVMVQDRIATGEDSLARILLGGKAVVTVRARSVVTITESPRVSTVDVETGKIALAVAKERMRPGESIQLRTPNAVAGIRGTVVIAEVSGHGVDAQTRFTLLTGVIEVLRLDMTRQPIGAAALLYPLQTISVDRALSPVRSITRSEGKAAAADFMLPVRPPTRDGADWVAKEQVTQAVSIIEPQRPRAGEARPAAEARPDIKLDKAGRVDRDDKPDKIDKSDKGRGSPVSPPPEPSVGPPIAPPATPIVPPSALQSSGKGGKGKGKER